MTILDTLSIARDLRKAGFSEQQAEAVATVVRQAAGMPDISNLATKDDVRVGLAELKADLQRWTIGLVFGAVVFNAVVVVTAMFGLAKLLGH
jgi:hypothetical protein